jgi:hypothetical protein
LLDQLGSRRGGAPESAVDLFMDRDAVAGARQPVSERPEILVK